MLLLNDIRENKEKFILALAKRGLDVSSVFEEIIQTDEVRRSTQARLDEILSQSNNYSKEIGNLFKSGEAAKANELKEKTVELKDMSKDLADKLNEAEEKLKELLYTIPNVPFDLVPAGNDENDNQEIFKEGDIPVLLENALPHWELAKKYDIIDLELGVKITGAGFPVYKGKGARLQRALISYFLDKNVEAGYTEYQVPLLVNEASGIGTGQLPDKEGQMYHVGVDNLYLIPTAEVPITNMFRGDLLNITDLPILCTGYTPCFRREAGSYGAHVRGLNRLHQFDKVELVRIEHPDNSYEALYSTAQERWLEISSVSNFETFQSNRLKLRFRDTDGKNRLAHTLNGSSLALPRVLAGILENYQTADGIKIPDVLVPYCGFDTID